MNCTRISRSRCHAAGALHYLPLPNQDGDEGICRGLESEIVPTKHPGQFPAPVITAPSASACPLNAPPLCSPSRVGGGQHQAAHADRGARMMPRAQRYRPTQVPPYCIPEGRAFLYPAGSSCPHRYHLESPHNLFLQDIVVPVDNSMYRRPSRSHEYIYQSHLTGQQLDNAPEVSGGKPPFDSPLTMPSYFRCFNAAMS